MREPPPPRGRGSAALCLFPLPLRQGLLCPFTAILPPSHFAAIIKQDVTLTSFVSAITLQVAESLRISKALLHRALHFCRTCCKSDAVRPLHQGAPPWRLPDPILIPTPQRIDPSWPAGAGHDGSILCGVGMRRRLRGVAAARSGSGSSCNGVRSASGMLFRPRCF